MCCSQLCSHCGWLLLKCSAIGIGFNGAETNCRIAHILGILLMNSCNTDRFLATTVVCGLSTLNCYGIANIDRTPDGDILVPDLRKTQRIQKMSVRKTVLFSAN